MLLLVSYNHKLDFGCKCLFTELLQRMLSWQTWTSYSKLYILLDKLNVILSQVNI